MNAKRRDLKGRILRNGEAQRTDGRYMYRFTDMMGKRHTVYSWKLVETDKVPDGKKNTPALRTLEKNIYEDLEAEIAIDIAKKITINDLFGKFLAIRTDLQATTRNNYIMLYNKHVKDSIGEEKIRTVKHSDIVKFYTSLHQKSGLKIKTIEIINGILWQLFTMALQDSVIKKSPVDGAMKEVAKKIKEIPQARDALTIDQQRSFIKYIYNSPKYKRYGPLFTVLLGTGLRIGEALGLTKNDIDFESGIIFIRKALNYKPTEQAGYEYHITRPKTIAGIREIPMFQDVRAALQTQIELNQNSKAPEFVVDGYKGFIFLNSAGKVYTPAFIFDVIQNVVADHNGEQKLKDNPIYIPKMSAHILRHTFCTRLCENEQNLKVIQEVMGHKDIRTTMNIYNNLTLQTKKDAFNALEGKIQIA